MIEIKKINKTYGRKVLFNDFDLEIKKGEFVIIKGSSGCGKTTLLNMIGAIEPYDSGQIIVDGMDIGKKQNHLHYFRTVVGFLFQNFALIEKKTVFQNLNMVKRKNVSKQDIMVNLEKLGISSLINQKIYTLSGGEQQRVALVRLMLQDVPLILADEPTGSLDRENGVQVLNILQQFSENGKTIILVTHDQKIITKGSRVIEL